ncbi:hypothetical protein ACKKBF_B41195 [Auxenochlorella protothecoides x Auxenochlorella symbiontica]
MCPTRPIVHSRATPDWISGSHSLLSYERLGGPVRPGARRRPVPKSCGHHECICVDAGILAGISSCNRLVMGDTLITY